VIDTAHLTPFSESAYKTDHIMWKVSCFYLY